MVNARASVRVRVRIMVNARARGRVRFSVMVRRKEAGLVDQEALGASGRFPASSLGGSLGHTDIHWGGGSGAQSWAWIQEVWRPVPAGRKGAHGCKSLARGLRGRLRLGRRAWAGALWPGQGCLSTLAHVFNQGNSRPMGSSVHGHLSVHSQHGCGVG